MKKIFVSILLVVIFLFNFLPCYAEKIALHFDSRQWELGYQAQNAQQGIVEYVLKGETVSNWSELVTAQIFFGLQNKTTPQKFMEDMKKKIETMCPKVMWNIIKKTDADILFEWEITNTPNVENQYEITRVISGKEGIHAIHYAAKKVPISSDKRNEWIKLLDSSALVSP